MDCVMKDQVQRKARNWSWTHMKEHRDLVRTYTNAWIEKRTNLNPSKEDLHIIEVSNVPFLFTSDSSLPFIILESGKGIGRLQFEYCTSTSGALRKFFTTVRLSFRD